MERERNGSEDVRGQRNMTHEKSNNDIENNRKNKNNNTDNSSNKMGQPPFYSNNQPQKSRESAFY
eukprot:CAMPEP_0171781886 /NCGR_PEP_ID=MMETSP0991-20121206/60512_1 /TAXON_ID=483369 /ORGANISM="non described non described, Strain CCMP2098" /LENGTH=64 /DNA_ID=CAMNT_0012389613 /DNA_START=51 /DNA_END=245 /DNA_ORIENTATION=+